MRHTVRTMRHTVTAHSPWHAVAKAYDELCNKDDVKDGGDNLYIVTVERIETEHPQWWEWHDPTSTWSLDHSDMPSVELHMYSNGTLSYCTVYGTTADRDAKRDALLETAKAVGKPEE